MELTDEKHTAHYYAASYACEDDLVKVVRINFIKKGDAEQGTIDEPVNSACLEMQRTGLDPLMKRLRFENGMAVCHDSTWPKSETRPLYDNPVMRKRFLIEYAKEFYEILAGNDTIRKCSMSHLKQIIGYVAKHLGEPMRVATEKIALPDELNRIPRKIPD